MLKGWCTRNLRREIQAYTRACEHLLSLDQQLTDEERDLLEYYLSELSRKYLSEKPTVRLRYPEAAAVEPSAT